MSAKIVEIADAVVSALNAAALSQPFIASRVYLPKFERSALESLTVTVVPKGRGETIAARSNIADDSYEIDVAVQQAVDPTDIATIDGLMLLVQEIHDLFRLTQPNLADSTYVGVSNDPIYDPAALNEDRLFRSVLTISYKHYR